MLPEGTGGSGSALKDDDGNQDDDCADELKWKEGAVLYKWKMQHGIKALMGGGYERSARYKAGEDMVFKEC